MSELTKEDLELLHAAIGCFGSPEVHNRLRVFRSLGHDSIANTLSRWDQMEGVEVGREWHALYEKIGELIVVWNL